MEQQTSPPPPPSSPTDLGIKTLSRLNELPVVSSTVNNVTDYYGKLRESNAILRTSCNLAELSFKTVAFAATPIKSLCKKPMQSVDSYLCDKVDSLETSYPSISKPTDQLTAQARDIYDKTIKQNIETLNNIKDFGTNKVTSVVKASGAGLDRQVTKSVDLLDCCLENRYAKFITTPVLDFTEKSLDYWIPAAMMNEQLEMNTLNDNNTKTIDQLADEPRTLKRLFDINNRIFKHLYNKTFDQLNKIHFQFDHMIKSLQALKKFVDISVDEKRQNLTKTLQSLKNGDTLLAQCAQFIDKNNLSLQKIEPLVRNYFKVILTDLHQLIDKYMSVVKNFPIVFNGTAINQMMENLKNQLNNSSLSAYITPAIEQLNKINQALLSYTNQMFDVVNNSKVMQLLKRMPTLKQINQQQQQQQQQQSKNNKEQYDTTAMNEIDQLKETMKQTQNILKSNNINNKNNNNNDDDNDDDNDDNKQNKIKDQQLVNDDDEDDDDFLSSSATNNDRQPLSSSNNNTFNSSEDSFGPNLI